MGWGMDLSSKQGIMLDVGCGEHATPGYVRMDKRALPGIDVVHDLEVFPYPIPDNACFRILLSHVFEHIEPKYRIQMMDELWRIMRHGGQLLVSAPYWQSIGAHQDPTHYPCPNEATFTYFDPRFPLYQVYRPRPWVLTRNAYRMTGNVEVVLEAVKDGDGACEEPGEAGQPDTGINSDSGDHKS